MVDEAISRTCREDVFIPSEGTDSTGVTGHGSDLLALFGIPDLDFALVGTDGDGASLYVQSCF